MWCERGYVEDLVEGARKFSRPLRHRVLSRHEHAQLFINVEKLSALSELIIARFHGGQGGKGAALGGQWEKGAWHGGQGERGIQESIGSLYLSKVGRLLQCCLFLCVSAMWLQCCCSVLIVLNVEISTC